MASRTITEAFSAVSDLKVWYNTQSGEVLKLSDITEIISLRWPFFRDNWVFMRDGLIELIPTYQYPDTLRTQIEDLTRYIDTQKSSGSEKINPFARSGIVSRFYAVWDNIPVSNVALTREEIKIIEKKINRISRFVRTDFENIRRKITKARDEVADTIGLSDPNYDKITQRSSVGQLRDPKVKDITQMQIFQNAIKSVNYLLANSNRLDTISVDPFTLARTNAKNPDINIVNGKSSRLVRMFYGDSLQSLAYKYLGDADRWIEIAIANGLKPPYVDEIGEAIPLLSNGEDSKINIAAVDSNGKLNIDKFYIDQPVFLSSSFIKFPEQRNILSIKEIPISGEIIIELSGDTDLDKFTTLDGASIRVYKPNTVNSNFYVSIPSDVPTNEVDVGETPFFLETKSEDEKNAGIDFLIDDSGDIVLGANGDLQLSYGLANALQAMKFKILSERGQSKRHPTYGLPNVVGKKVRDPEAIYNTLIDGINEMVEADPRFDRIEQIDVVPAEQSGIRIGLVVRLAGTGTLLPLNFKLNSN